MWVYKPYNPKVIKEFFRMTHEDVWPIVFKPQPIWPSEDKKGASSSVTSASALEIAKLNRKLQVSDEELGRLNSRFDVKHGAFAVYLKPWHADIFEFLDLRKNHGKIYLIHLKSTLSYRCLCKS
ncbi:ribonucleoside-diphosphate reductase large subunit [Hordeum vulgare]|nr:ribonucleoside-diphosphate reductase large subunit [Hordeum vulgare]